MNNLPRNVRSKDANLEKILNQILAAIRAGQVISTPTVTVDEVTANGTKLRAAPASGVAMREISICKDGESDWFAMVAMGEAYKKDEDGVHYVPE